METANNMPEMIVLIEDGPLRIPHSPSHVCVSWDSEKAQERIATCLDDYRYHGNDCLKLPLVEVSSFSKLHVCNLRLAHGAGSLAGCFPLAVSSAPLSRRHKKFGWGHGKETDSKLLLKH